jgi:hypothetical protein
VDEEGEGSGLSSLMAQCGLSFSPADQLGDENLNAHPPPVFFRIKISPLSHHYHHRRHIAILFMTSTIRSTDALKFLRKNFHLHDQVES